VIQDSQNRNFHLSPSCILPNINTIAHALIFEYDKRSQMTDADISNIGGGHWVAHYSYHDNGDMAYRAIQSDNQSFFYNGYSLTNADGNSLDYDKNGQLTAGIGTSLVWNWDNKLRSAEKGNTAINLKYDPAGNRIAKDVNVSQTLTARKYIVDIVGDLPTILLELNPNDSMNIEKIYIYANSQIVAQHDGNSSDPRYFYLHDRLGSVREIINTSGSVVKFYTYQPFGETIESGGTFINPFKFTGQWFDPETGYYYLRTRQYDPYISRFTSRDPVFGQFEEPITLHKYLYCGNDPLNQLDPTGLITFHITGTVMGSFGWSGVRQSGFVFDDKGNCGWINVTGIGAGIPNASAGVSIGVTSAETIFDLAEWGGDFGASVSGDWVGLPVSVGGDIILGRNWWGAQVTFSGNIPDWIPLEFHGHVSHSTVYSFEEIRDSFTTAIEAYMYEVKTLGEAEALLFTSGMLESISP
jgi:RHS repeat-associated protein